MKNSLRKEDEALFVSVAGDATVARARLRELIACDFDWDRFYSLARRHAIVPLVYSQLNKSVGEFVPTAALEQFRKDYQENAARNILFADELTSIIEVLAQAGIEAITFKGPALAVAAYGDLSLRRFVDLDLIVRREDVARAIDVLVQRGYAATRTLDSRQQALLLDHQHNLQFARGRMLVELHSQVASELFASTVTAEELWQEQEAVRIRNHEVKTLGREDLLFALCVHGSRHLWQRLAWICDIDRLLTNQPKLNWSRVIARADKANARRMFLLGPALAAKVLGTLLPDALDGAIKSDSRIAALVNEIQQRLCDERFEAGAGVFSTLRHNLLVRSDWRSRFRYLRFALALTDSDVEAIRLAPRFQFMYYVLRPLRIFRAARSRGAR